MSAAPTTRARPAADTPGPLETMGRRIRILRMERGWSGADLARHVGVSRMAVSAWEAGAAPNSTNLIALTRALGCTLEFLMGDWRRDAAMLAECVEHAARAGVVSWSRAAELCRAFDLPRAPDAR